MPEIPRRRVCLSTYSGMQARC